MPIEWYRKTCPPSIALFRFFTVLFFDIFYRFGSTDISFMYRKAINTAISITVLHAKKHKYKHIDR